MASRSESLNAIKLHLIIHNIATKAVQYKLEKEIKALAALNANSVSTFLASKYDHLIDAYTNRRQMPCYVLDFIKTLNPEYPSKRASNQPFPEQLERFDLTACYQIAKSLLSLQYPDIQCFEDLIIMRNEFYGHLNFLKTSDSLYEANLERLKKIVMKLSESDARLKEEIVCKISEINGIKRVADFDVVDLEAYEEFFKRTRFHFFYSTMPFVEKRKNVLS